ncbi:endonuclease domain-containing protein [Streptomyces sp. NBC_00444]|uniref:endonuclease domain-containing protein n=1 Tax=Streptomyces sp. NBC_00444 TaxID=2975744 RepID=UPI003FA7EF45
MTCRDRRHYENNPNERPRTCRRCKDEFPADQFRLRKVTDRKVGGYRRESICLTCSRADAVRRARARAEAGHPWSNPIYQLRHFARKVCKVDADALVEYVEGHPGFCEICGRTGEEVHRNGRRLAVDHSDAGVRGLLCHSCNTALGHFGDDPVRILRAIEYLARKPVIPAQNAEPA